MYISCTSALVQGLQCTLPQQPKSRNETVQAPHFIRLGRSLRLCTHGEKEEEDIEEGRGGEAGQIDVQPAAS